MTDTIRAHVEAMGVDPVSLKDTDEYYEVVVQLPVGAEGSVVNREADIINPYNALTPGSYVQVRRRIGALSDPPIAPPAPPPPPPPSFFFDEPFDGTALNPDLWTVAAGSPSVSNGKLSMPLTNPRSLVRSKQNIAFAGKSAEFRGWTAPLAPNETGKVRSLRVQAPTATYNYVRFMRLGSGLLYMDGVNIPGVSIAYDAAAHANLRFRVADKLYYEASADGATWMALRAIDTVPAFLGSPAQVEISAGSDSTTASDPSIVATLDGFRVP